MEGSIWKDLLDRLGCLDNGRFVAPRDISEVFITLGSNAHHGVITLRRDTKAPDEWSYTDDFIIYNDTNGHTIYYPWYAVDTVNTNEA